MNYGNLITTHTLVQNRKGGEKKILIPKSPAATTPRRAVMVCKQILYAWTGKYGIRSPLIAVVKVTCGCGKSKTGMSVAYRDTDDKIWKAVVSVCKNCGKVRTAKPRSKPKKRRRPKTHYDINRFYDWDF